DRQQLRLGQARRSQRGLHICRSVSTERAGACGASIPLALLPHRVSALCGAQWRCAYTTFGGFPRMSWHLRALSYLSLLTLLAGSGCAALGGPQAQSTGPIKIGMVTSLTGNYAPLGTNDKLAVQQVVDQLNNKGGLNGRKIDLEILDDASDPNQTVIQFNKVISDGAVAVLGPPQSTADLASRPIV